MADPRKRWAAFCVFLLLGGLLGTVVGQVIGEFLPEGTLRTVLATGTAFGVREPATLDLGVLAVTFGCTFRIGLCGLLGALGATIYFLKA